MNDLYTAGATVLRLPLDDPPGSTEFIDRSATRRRLRGRRVPDVGVPGRQELALLFDGLDDTVEVNNANTGDLQKLAVAAWVRLNSLPGRRHAPRHRRGRQGCAALR